MNLTTTKKSKVEHIVEDSSTHPHCPHGPTSLFSGYYSKNSDTPQYFFACSAYRRHINCSFLIWQENFDKIWKRKEKIWAEKIKSYMSSIDHSQKSVVLKQIRDLPANERSYCATCTVLVLPENRSEHTEHQLMISLSDYYLLHPSKFLKPISDKKKAVRYFYANSSVSVIVDILRSLSIRKILCIGSPSIHEFIHTEDTGIYSLLLDIDKRLHSFFTKQQFCWYNLYNHHFFTAEGKEVYSDFLQINTGGKVAVIIDPPFNGRVEAIAQTLNKIQEDYKLVNDVNDPMYVFLFFPYLMELDVQNGLPHYKMTDFKIHYTSTPLFDDGIGRKCCSPVRFFTNVELSKIALPDDLYKFCSLCKRWVYKENEHCTICDSCTTKDGETYIHCNLCKKCVKPTCIHCTKCEQCIQPNHKCGDLEFEQTCLHCKERGHKQSKCPKFKAERLKLKRQLEREKRDSEKKMCILENK